MDTLSQVINTILEDATLSYFPEVVKKGQTNAGYLHETGTKGAHGTRYMTLQWAVIETSISALFVSVSDTYYLCNFAHFPLYNYIYRR